VIEWSDGAACWVVTNQALPPACRLPSGEVVRGHLPDLPTAIMAHADELSPRGTECQEAEPRVLFVPSQSIASNALAEYATHTVGAPATLTTGDGRTYQGALVIEPGGTDA